MRGTYCHLGVQVPILWHIDGPHNHDYLAPEVTERRVRLPGVTPRKCTMHFRYA